jgi:hypothetical protein
VRTLTKILEKIGDHFAGVGLLYGIPVYPRPPIYPQPPYHPHPQEDR